MDLKILCLPGDGIGQEVMEVARPIAEKVAAQRGHNIKWDHGLVGFAAFDRHQDTMPEITWKQMEACDGVLFGAVGLPARDGELAPQMRPEKRALLPIRKKFGLAVNIRPVKVYPKLEALSPLREDVARGVDLTFFRELNGGIYFGERKRDPDNQWASDLSTYHRHEIERIARSAMLHARAKRQKVTSVDKANVLDSTGLFWRETVSALHRAEFSDVTLEHCLVDAFNLYLFTRPSSFRIVLTENLFGDILSDGAAGVAGSMGLLPSASINPENGYGLYEPSGGSAPDIAGQDKANPIAMILSVALMFRYSFKDEVAAQSIEAAVEGALQRGLRTRDLLAGGGSGARPIGTREMAGEILKGLRG